MINYDNQQGIPEFLPCLRLSFSFPFHMTCSDRIIFFFSSLLWITVLKPTPWTCHLKDLTVMGSCL